MLGLNFTERLTEFIRKYIANGSLTSVHRLREGHHAFLEDIVVQQVLLFGSDACFTIGQGRNDSRNIQAVRICFSVAISTQIAA